MEILSAQDDLPNPDSPHLHLTQATQDECVRIWTNTSTSWKDSLTVPGYLQEQQYLTTAPLANKNGMTIWVLVERNVSQNHRRIFCSCESYSKRSLMANLDGKIDEVIVHGVASVFCPVEYRQRGYATRHMIELAKTLPKWQSDQFKVAGSVLYSDIGRSFYAKLGWRPNITNWHVEFPSMDASKPSLARELVEDDLGELCEKDETIIRKAMSTWTDKAHNLITILPDRDHMLWHIAKENFATEWLFGKRPHAKGAIAGLPGNRVWAIWTHRYYMHPNAEAPNNVLYILRLVAEGDDSANQPPSAPGEGLSTGRPEREVDSLIAVLQSAQAEAAEWQLDYVKLWEPSLWVQNAIEKSNIDHRLVKREDDSIASCQWYNEHGGYDAAPVWINNEHYAWC